MTGMHAFADEARQRCDRLVETQQEAIGRAAGLLCDSLRHGGVVQAFGTGHSRSLAMELASRAGGLVASNRISVSDLLHSGDLDLETVTDPLLERDPDIAHRLWAFHRIEPADVFVIASNSGGNGAIVEFAQLARSHGHPVIAITSIEHSSAIESRHASRRKLMDEADVVIDNCGPFGDAVVEVRPGVRACGISTITSALAAQMMVAEALSRLAAADAELPVYHSANVPGGDDHNDRLRVRYEGRIFRGDA